jgi:hypothetical protein
VARESAPVGVSTAHDSTRGASPPPPPPFGWSPSPAPTRGGAYCPMRSAFPGRSAARSDALQTRDRKKRPVCEGPGSAVQHHSASKTRVNALTVLHRIRDTPCNKNPFPRHVVCARALPTTTPEKCRLKKGGEAPKGACQPWAVRAQASARDLRHLSAARLRALAGRARLPALRPRLWSETVTSLTRLQAMLPGTWTAHDRKITRGLSRRALPAPSCPSPVTAPHASAVIPKGMMPKAAPVRLAKPHGSTAPAPHSDRIRNASLD